MDSRGINPFAKLGVYSSQFQGNQPHTLNQASSNVLTTANKVGQTIRLPDDSEFHSTASSQNNPSVTSYQTTQPSITTTTITTTTYQPTFNSNGNFLGNPIHGTSYTSPNKSFMPSPISSTNNGNQNLRPSLNTRKATVVPSRSNLLNQNQLDELQFHNTASNKK